MSNRKFFIFIKIFILFFANSCHALRVLSNHEPPTTYAKGGQHVEGLAYDIVADMLREMNLNLRIEIYPWKRAYTMVQKGPQIALFSTNRNEAREKKFRWVGPLVTKNFGLYKLASNPRTIKELDQAKNALGIGVQLGGWQDEYLTTRNFKNLVRSTTHQELAKRLVDKRAELWFVGDLDMLVAAELNFFVPDTFDLAYLVRTSSNWLAFSIDTKPETIKTWQAAFDKLLANGRLNEIGEKWSKRLKMNIQASEQGLQMVPKNPF